MLGAMSCRQLIAWKVAWNQLGGWGPQRSEFEMGMIAATIANAAPMRKRRRAFQPRQFMPTFGRRQRSRHQSEAEMFAEIDAFLGVKQ